MKHTLLHGDIACYRRHINDLFAKLTVLNHTNPFSTSVASLDRLNPILPVAQPLQFNVNMLICFVMVAIFGFSNYHFGGDR